MITVKAFVVNPIQVNTYILSDDTRECVIVDAACYIPSEFSKVKQYISDNQLTPVALLNTHGHIDHILGIAEFSKLYSIPFLIHHGDSEYVQQAPHYAAMFGFECSVFPVVSSYFSDHEIIRFGKSTLEVLHTPGHTQGCCCFYNEENKLLLTGDTLFSGSIGRTDLPGGNFDQIIERITTQLLVLPDDTIVYPGHGRNSTIGEEKNNNPFLNK